MHWLKNIALLFGVSVFCLFMGELFVRLFVPQQLILHDDVRIHCPDSVTCYRHQPNIDVMVNLGEGLVRFVTDENGYRINADTPSRTDDTDYRILTLGDSFLEGLQVENEQTMPQVIAKLLKEQYDIDAQVDNSGVGGWNPNNYYLEAKQALARKQYDLGIVFIYADNDFVEDIDTVMYTPDSLNSSIHRFHFPNEFTWAEIISSVLYPINDLLERNSHLFIFVKSRSEFLLSKLGLTAYYFPDVYLLNQHESIRWEITGMLCGQIKAEFERYDMYVCQEIMSQFDYSGIPVLFVLLPATYQVHEQVFYDYVDNFSLSVDSVDLEQPNKLFAEQCEKHSLHLIDMLEPMREKAKQGKVLFGSIDRHFNAEGHYVVAEHIVPTIANYLMK